MTGHANRLLIADDESLICSFIEKVAKRLGYAVQAISDATQFREQIQAFQPTILITDLKMPGCDGVQLLQIVKELGCQANIVVISGMDERVLNTAEKLGRSLGLNMLGVLQKPLVLAKLESVLRDASRVHTSFTVEDLRSAIAAGQMVVHYQPKISRDNGTWSIEGAEALVRWQHATHGVIMPSKFIALAEQSGLIAPLTDLVLRNSVQQLANWSARGLRLNVAVNVSAPLIDDSTFPDRIRSLLAEHKVAGSMLTLELTETAAMADPTKAMNVCLRLRVSDVGLAIDDFGTGFSSLKQLYELPFDEIKIDRSFIHGLPGDDQAKAIVRATTDMAHALNMKVCAEGVETYGALEYLESVGCDRAQGFLVSPAVPAAEFENLLSSWSAQALRRRAR